MIRAKKCPHFLTLRFVTASGQDEMCRGCRVKPLTKYGQYRKPGPTDRLRTTKTDPSEKGYLRRKVR